MPRERLFFLFFFFFCEYLRIFIERTNFLMARDIFTFSVSILHRSEERKEKREKIDLRFNDYNKVTLS